MFYAEAILSKKGPLAKVWLASHLERKLTKAQLLQASIPSSVGAIIGQDQGPPLALRLSGQLLLGVARIYARKARYLLEDCNEALIRIKMAFRPGAADITSDAMVATHNAITLPEALTEFDVLLPSSTRMLGTDGIGAGASALNTSRIQDITLAEQSFDISMVARGIGSANDLDLGEEDLLGRDDDFRLDLDDDFVFSPPGQQPATPGARLNTSAFEPELGRDAMLGLDESTFGMQSDLLSPLRSKIGGQGQLSEPMDITREDLGAGIRDGEEWHFGGDNDALEMASGLGDVSMVPSTQEAALQAAEAEVLVAGAHPERLSKRRRLNLSDLVANEATSLSPDEIRGRLHDCSDIVRVPTYLPPTKAARLEDMSSLSVAMRFLDTAGSGSDNAPFAALFAPPSGHSFDVDANAALRLDEMDASIFSAADNADSIYMDRRESLVPEYASDDDGFRLEYGSDGRDNDRDSDKEVTFGTSANMAAQQPYTEQLLANKSFEQLKRMEEESFQREAEAQRGSSVGISLFDAPPVGSETGKTGETSEISDARNSKSTICAIHILDTACRAEGIVTSDAAASAAALSYMGVTKGVRRKDAVKLFFELLVLKTNDFIDVAQPAPFEDIMIAPRAKLQRAADAINTSGGLLPANIAL
ncbi:sister chromatid cohesion protein 1 [Kickxella alabastrina]|nr:sister chromatid cohesion protein 1 [Kickxella alabastrina]